MAHAIAPSKFYGNSLKSYEERDGKKELLGRKRFKFEEIDLPQNLFRPAENLKTFWKQKDALNYMVQNDTGSEDILCCFVGQDTEGRRHFVVTYPTEFWQRMLKLSPEERNFFEVIPENAPCFIYFDLEFVKELNLDRNATRMTKTLIDITCSYLQKHSNYSMKLDRIIDLDSSRKDKFSKHLIFSSVDVAFANNYQVGRFVKKISRDILKFLSGENEKSEILENFDKTCIEELFIVTDKGDKKLFMDLSVYSRNRHFRVYKATKWGQHSFLRLAKECTFGKAEGLMDIDIFYSSLVSYHPRKNKLKLMDFNEVEQEDVKIKIKHFSSHSNNAITKEHSPSPYPLLDNFIAEYVNPGKIRESKYIEHKKVIIFEIVGNRFCENIGRAHKSNNIYFVVDLASKKWFQKCHDEDCSGFISASKILPVKIAFQLADEDDKWLSSIHSVN